MKAEELRSIVMLAMGEASMCWIPTPSGEFDSKHAVDVGERLIAAILEIANSK